MNLRHPLSLAVLTLAASLALSPAMAQIRNDGSDASSGAPARVDAFSVGQLNRVVPGSELEFTLNGTPGAEVTLEIAGAGKVVKMDETRPGHYEGSYTVRSRDRVTAASLVTARLSKDGRSVSASLDESVVSGSPSPAGTPVKIAAFAVTAPDRVRPGDDLAFSMTGTPGAKAGVAVKGVRDRIALAEVGRGTYEGHYTVRRQDRPEDSLSATGYLTANHSEANQRFERESRGPRNERREDRREETRAAPGCANCGVVEAVNLVESKTDGNNVIGTLAGGVLGGVLGHQVGGGTGKDLATIAGAVGGAYAGNRVENNVVKSRQYQVVVRLEGGTVQTFTYAADPALKVGSRVKIENNAIVRN